jgi:ABC-type anion transport system duplicated permease subunit
VFPPSKRTGAKNAGGDYIRRESALQSLFRPVFLLFINSIVFDDKRNIVTEIVGESEAILRGIIDAILELNYKVQMNYVFNVIAGAMAIPTDMKEAAGVFRFSLVDRWRLLILPGVFPYLVTGMVTAAGGAWNASIVAEYFRFKGQTLSTTGLGATISQATDAGDFTLLLASTITMAAMVVTINRLVWRRLYRLAEMRFKLES